MKTKHPELKSIFLALSQIRIWTVKLKKEVMSQDYINNNDKELILFNNK